jgi:uncharacterized oxidoreductase
MKTSGNTILVTGGATGIGFSLAEEFVKLGNEVIICGRREDKLEEAKNKLPQIHTRKCDLSKEDERKSLFEWISSDFPKTNILVNNAGIQRMVDLKKGTEELFSGEDEIEINFKAYVNLSAYFIPFLMKQNEAAIVNISSGLGFIPLTITPVYCATKAAIHSFSISLRHQLRNTSVKVFEIIPPTVDTELDKGARAKRRQEDRGINPIEVANATIDALEKDKYETGVGRAENLRTASAETKEQIFERMNQW